MAKKKGLGRGLASLIPSAEPAGEAINAEAEKVGEAKPTGRKPDRKDGGAKRAVKKSTAENARPEKKASTKADKNTKKQNTERLKPEESAEGSSAGEAVLAAMQTLAIELMETNPDQPRKYFEPEALEELSESIRTYGILQPIVVKRHSVPGRAPYEIVAGERRYRAAKLAGLSEVPVVLRDGDEKESAMLSVVENVQRRDLTPLEEAFAYQQIMRDQMLTQQELGDALGKSRAYIANIVRLLNLDNDSMEALSRGLLTSSQARSLLSESDLSKRAKLRTLLVEGRTNVNAVERTTSKAKKPQGDIFVRELENRMSESLGTKVAINKKRRGWSVSLACYTKEDLEAVAARLIGALND